MTCFTSNPMNGSCNTRLDRKSLVMRILEFNSSYRLIEIRVLRYWNNGIAPFLLAVVVKCNDKNADMHLVNIFIS